MLNNITDWFIVKKKIIRKYFVIFLTLIETLFFMLGVQSAELRYGAGEEPLPVFSDVGNPTPQPSPVFDSTTLPVSEGAISPIPVGTPLPVPGITTSPDVNSEPSPSSTIKPDNSPEPTPSTNIIDIENIEVPIYRGNRDEKTVFFTFDDGYDKESLSNVLDTLKEKNIRSTFFVVGDYLKYFPDLWKRAVEEGHYICNHTNSHRILTSLTEEEIRKEITGWEDTISEIIGDEYLTKMKKEFPFFRMPGGGGHNNDRILTILSEYGYIPVGWSLETYDSIIRHHNTNKEPLEPIIDAIVNHVVKNSQNGIIILLHFNYLDTPKLDEMIDGIIEKGLSIKNLESILSNVTKIPAS